MKIILDIKDNKVDFVMELLANLKFVKAKPLSPNKEEILWGLSDAVEEVKLAKKGKLKLGKASQLLDEI